MYQIKKFQSLPIIIISLLILGFAWLGMMQAAPASAQGIKSNLCEGASLSLESGSGTSCQANAGAENRVNRLITSIVNIISVIVGIIAVIMIIIGGLKFITSGGDSGKVSSAKSTILYALVGLIIVALAQFIVRFVLGKLT